MANMFSNFIQQVIQGDSLKDWDHASKLYVANNYNLAPKNTFLYHVFFDLNPVAVKLNQVGASIQQTELGMLVKQVSLPKFSIDTKTLNAYNRSHIVQTKLKYDPINIQFHDDAADLTRNFWFDYYNYYYRDSDYGSDFGGSRGIEQLNQARDEIAGTRINKDWGYTIRGSQGGTIVKAPYLSSIRIYSLYNKMFSEYILVNPFIKTFQHGEHNASDSTGTLTNTMTVEYESVVYAYGKVTGDNVRGFGELHYDKRPSPLTPAGGGTQSIFGQGGVAQTVSEIGADLATGNLASAALKGARTGNTLKSANLKSMALSEAVSMGKSVLTGNNPFGQINVPGAGTLTGGTKSTMGNGVNNMQTGGSGSQGVTASSIGTGGLTNLLGGSGATGIFKSVTNTITDAGSNIYKGVSNFVSGKMPSNLTSSTAESADEEIARIARSRTTD